MRFKNWKVNRNAKKSGVLLAAGVLTAQRVLGGSVFMSPPPVVTTPVVAQEDATNNEMSVFIANGVVNPSEAGLLQYGDVILHPHVSYNFTYGNGIQSSVGTQGDTALQQLSPGLTVDLGRHWTADYTPTINFYSSRQFRNTVDQSASLSGATHYQDWSFSGNQNYSSTSDPLTETGAQTSQQSYGTALSAAYDFNDKWSANANVQQNINLVSGFQDSYAWTGLGGVSYQFAPRLSAGFSAGGGYTRVQTLGIIPQTAPNAPTTNPDIVNEQGQFNVNWRATDKVSFQASAGLEDQQFLASGYKSSLEPIFSAAVQYQPFKVTQISLSASRTVGASDYDISAQSTEATTISLNVNQRILVKYNLNVGFSYTKDQYTESLNLPGGSLGTERTDNDYSFNASFGRSFLTYGNWAITYQYNDNQSSSTGFSQRSNQIGFRIGFTY